MTRSRNPLRNWMTALCGAAALIACATVLADPPGRVARLAQIGGTVSFSPAGEDEWVLAQPNRPLVTGDRVWSDAGSRAELQIGSASARLGSNTSAAILNLDDRVVQIEIAQGTLNLRVRRVYADQVFEIDTPNLAFSIRRAGDYRIDVDANGDATIIRVRSGQGEAWGEGAAYVVGTGQQYTFQGTGLRDYYVDALPPPDEFDNWTFGRNRREDATPSARYVSPDVVGYSDLDEYGTWRSVEGYGNTWFPTSVAADWVPYRTGHWGWIDPWGWTWIDEAPWGFAPFHYGRWAYVGSRWGWIPGPIAVRPIYAPALVAFIGGGGFSLSLSTGPVLGIGWFPLGPGEVYRPAYAASRTYFTNVNVSNTVVNTTVVNNYYNNTVTNIVYRNREAPGAVTAVPTAAFTGAQPVARNHIAVSRDVVARQSVSNVVAVAPSHTSVLAVGAAAAGATAAVAVAKRPPPAALERRVVAKTAPPPPPPSFATKASLLAAQPGKPLETEKLKGMQPARAAEAQKIKVVAPSAAAPQPLSKEGGGKGARAERAATPGPTPPGAATAPQPPQERAMREGKGRPAEQAAPAPQPPQERAMREGKGGPPPQAAPVPQPPQERAMREGKGGAPPQAAPVPLPPQERAMREGKGRPAEQAAPAPQTQPQERAQRAPPPPQAAPAPPLQERAMREGKGGPPPQAAPVPQPPPQERAQRAPPPPQAAPAPPPQERAMREGKGRPPEQAAPVPQPPPQERAQRAPPPPQAAPVPQPPPQEEGKGKGRGKDQKEKDKDKEKEKEKEKG